MTRSVTLASILVLAGTALAAGSDPATPSANPTNLATTAPTTQQAVKQYTCPMHPDVISDKPGKCPKCGMTLVEKKNEKGQDNGGMHMK